MVQLRRIDVQPRGQTEQKKAAGYVIAMLLLICVGVLGAWLHIRENLVPGGVTVVERFIRGAPFLAPLLFADMGALGLVALLDARENSDV